MSTVDTGTGRGETGTGRGDAGRPDPAKATEPATSRDPIGQALRALNKLAGTRVLDRLKLRKPAERVVYDATRSGFTTIAALNRSFRAAQRLGRPVRLPSAPQRDLFDLTPSDEQRLIQETVREFATAEMRPAAAEADRTCSPPDTVLDRATQLGVALAVIPEEFGGAGTEHSAITGTLVAEAMGYGDMGLAVACLAPSAVSSALVHWGDENQQATYLPSFTTENVPAAALAIVEPHPLFDPFTLRTRATTEGADFRLDGTKSLVPRATDAELFVVAADLDGGGPALFLLESGTPGVTVEAEPSMGLRGAGMGRLVLDGVRVRRSMLMGSMPKDSADHRGDDHRGDDHRAADEAYRECVRLSRIAWSALAVGTAQAVLDYVIPYVNEREAFGEPISHRQGVAFTVADIGIEIEGMRLATYRAASRAAQGRTHAREVALARRLCVDKGMAIGSDGVQLLGGHGYIKDHPVERWYRDLRSIGVAEGIVLV